MMRYFLLLALALLLLPSAKGQLLPPNRPEQDPCDAIAICGDFMSNYSYQGIGMANNLPSTPCGAGESNSVWIKLTIQSAGKLVFKIIPITPSDDYDFAVIDGTGKPCGFYSSSDVVRCNFNKNSPVTNGGQVGLSLSSTLISVPSGTAGSNFCQYLDVAAGEVYYIMINNAGNGYGTGLSGGFSISLAGSTAIINQPPPIIATGTTNSACSFKNQVKLDLSGLVRCNSLAANGSDFYLSPSGTVLSASSTVCGSSGYGYTNNVTVNFDGPLAPGTYTLHSKVGTDGNTLLNICNMDIAPGALLSFVVPEPIYATDVQQYCQNELPTTWNGITIPATATSNPAFAVYNTQTADGCDSIVTLSTTIIPIHPTTITSDTSACGQLTINGKTYYSSLLVTDTIKRADGCDSVYNNIDLTIYRNEPNSETYTTIACGTTLHFRGRDYTSDTSLSDTLRDIHGCDSFIAINKLILQDFKLGLIAQPDKIVIGEYTTLTATSRFPFEVLGWAPADLFPAQQAKAQTIMPATNGTYRVFGKSDLGCIDTAEAGIEVSELFPDFVMPSAFSPNNDGKNDIFRPIFANKRGYVVKSFYIFNRYGEQVYKAEATRNSGWDGSYSNGTPAATGVYYYIIEVAFVNKEIVTKKGDVTLIR